MINFDPRDISLFVARGCWGRLHYFENPQMPGAHNPEKQLATIKEYLHKYKVQSFEFMDYCNVNTEYLNDLCDRIIKDKLKFGWSAPAVMDPGMDYALISNMAKAGCKKLTFDLFSLPRLLLKEMKIMFEPEASSKLLSLCHREGISVGINLFFGHPRETWADFDSTIGFLSDNKPYFDEITKVTFCPSSYIFSASLETPLCRYWSQCLGFNDNCTEEFKKLLFSDCLTKIIKLGKPIAKIEPNEIIFNELLNCKIDQDALPQHSISNGRIVVSYSSGGLQFFWNNIRITTNVGLNIAMNIGGKWKDSTDGTWNVSDRKNGCFKVNIAFASLPVKLIWQIKITGDYRISWKLKAEMEKTLPIEEIRIVCLVDHRYSKWFNDYRQSGFPPPDNQWHDLSEEELAVSRVGLRPTLEVALPLFMMEIKNKNIFSLVQNTPIQAKARIIGFRHKVRKERKIGFSGKYVFEGEIGLSKIA